MKLLKSIFKKGSTKPLEFRRLIDTDIGCIASDKITKDLLKVGYMYREAPLQNWNPDSGWRFLSGTEDEEYMNNSANHRVHLLNNICNYDEEIIPYLDAIPGSAFIRKENGILGLDTGDEELIPPKMIDGANVLYYITTNQYPFLGYCTETETKFKQFYAALVIAQYDRSNNFYVFMCDSKFETINDRDYCTLEEAMSYRDMDKQSKWIKIT